MPHTPIPAVTLANTFVARYSQIGLIDHLKLQKLCYFCYGFWLALRPNELPLTSSKPQVWKLGPVFRPIYAAFAQFGGSAIYEAQPIGPFEPAEPIANNNSQESQFVDWIWRRYGHLSGITLSELTHAAGTPWSVTAQRYNYSVPRFLEMDDDENRAYFTRMAKEEGFLQ